MTERQVSDIVKRFQSIDLEKVVIDASRQEKQSIIDLQEEQLSDGLSSKGDELNPPYTKRTIEIRKGLGLRTDVVTLQRTGAFRRREYVKFAREGFEVNSRDKKTADLVAKYHSRTGGEVFGLSPESQAIFGAIILPLIQDKFRGRLLR